MSLQRKAIRTALVSALIAANTAAGTRVYASRVVPWDRVELPALAVYFERGVVEVFEVGPRRNKHTQEMRIECVAEIPSAGSALSKKDPQTLEDTLDVLAAQAANVLYLDPHIAGTCRDARLVGDEFHIRHEGKVHTAALVMRWEVEFFQQAPEFAPDLDDLEIVGVDWDLAPPDEVIEAQDEIQIEQEASP